MRKFAELLTQTRRWLRSMTQGIHAGWMHPAGQNITSYRSGITCRRKKEQVAQQVNCFLLVKYCCGYEAVLARRSIYKAT